MGEFSDAAINSEATSSSNLESSHPSIVMSTNPVRPVNPETSSKPVSTSGAIASTTGVVESTSLEDAATSGSDTTSTSVMETSSSETSRSMVVTSTVQTTAVPSSRPMSTSSTMAATSSIVSTPSSTRTTTVLSTASVESTRSLPETTTRPIITPRPTITTGPAQLITANSHLTFGEIVGLVAAVVVVLGTVGFCLMIGPRRALRKIRIGKKKQQGEYEEWEDEGAPGQDTTGRPSSVAASDWWRAPPGALGSQVSNMSMGGPGMAGVGAGIRAVQAPSSNSRVEERKTVRSGWFAASMVRGASLLSLGSMLKPEPSPNATEMRQVRGGQGSAGKRFQELYRREREMGATEMGERGASHGRVSYPGVRRPSRLGSVPAILVQDATLPSLSSASHVTGQGYDADAEAEAHRVY